MRKPAKLDKWESTPNVDMEYLLIIILITPIWWILTTAFSTVNPRGGERGEEANFWLASSSDSKTLGQSPTSRKKRCKKKSDKDSKLNFKLLHLCEAPSFPEPEAAFTLSPALTEIPEVPLDFLAEALSFVSEPFPSDSALACTGFGVYKSKKLNKVRWPVQNF